MAVAESESEHYHTAAPTLWFWAVLLAIALHCSILLAIEFLHSDESEETTGAAAVEISVERTSPHVHPIDLPPGPEADASTASPAVMEQMAEVERTELPKATPTETDDPDRLVTPNEVKRQKDEDPKKSTVRTPPAVASIASEATTMPSSDNIPEAVRSVAPALGPGDSATRERMTWQKELAAHLDKHKRYPTDRSRRTAEIILSFVLDRAGHVLSASIARSSGDKSFDDATLAMMRRADPVPPPPPRFADEGLSFTLPVIFNFKGK
jgi:periplasmic protein TonB